MGKKLLPTHNGTELRTGIMVSNFEEKTFPMTHEAVDFLLCSCADEELAHEVCQTAVMSVC